MARNIAIFRGQTRPTPPMWMDGKGFAYQIAYFDKPMQIELIVSKAQNEAIRSGGNAIVDAEFKDTMKDGKPYMREFSGTVVYFHPR